MLDSKKNTKKTLQHAAKVHRGKAFHVPPSTSVRSKYLHQVNEHISSLKTQTSVQSQQICDSDAATALLNLGSFIKSFCVQTPSWQLHRKTHNNG